MKLWKRAIFAFVLFSVTLLLLLTIIMIPAGSISHWALFVSVHPSSTASTPSPPPSSTSMTRVTSHQRVVRATDGMGSVISEVSYLFQSFTKNELQRAIRSLVDRKVRRRTKRAKKGTNECSLHEVVLTVSELGLGYESDETVNFRYCSGKCNLRRRNYDMVLEHMRLNDASTDKGCPSNVDRTKKDRARYSPCCRPTKYERKMSFFDNNAKFFTIRDVSAIECGCI